jgi:prepilin-type N-terminal cleavage/methylation domain-containing protein
VGHIAPQLEAVSCYTVESKVISTLLKRPALMHRRAVTLVELLVVLVILAGLVGLLLPAVQAAREKAREAVCKNNLHQLNLAMANFAEAHKRLPAPNPVGVVGGWTIEILPFLEQANLEQSVRTGIAIADAPDFLSRPPSIFRCPIRDALDEDTSGVMHSGHYVFVPADRRDSFRLYDAPLQLSVPWASGPEMAPRSVTRLVGPHHGGFFAARGFQQGVDYAEGGNSR